MIAEEAYDVGIYAGHTGIVVQDLDLVGRFYIEVLGLKEVRRFSREGPQIDELLRLTNVRLDAVFLGTPDRPAAIELLKYVRHPSAVVTRIPNTHGTNHVHFIVNDLDPILEQLDAHGIASIGGPVDWFDTWSRVLYTRDPEDNIVEITEISDGGPLPYAPDPN